MSKRIIWALLLIVLRVVMFVFNDHKIAFDVGFFKAKVTAAFVYLGFTSVGVVIGTMLR